MRIISTNIGEKVLILGNRKFKYHRITKKFCIWYDYVRPWNITTTEQRMIIQKDEKLLKKLQEKGYRTIKIYNLEKNLFVL